jgi:hypothetical protein
MERDPAPPAYLTLGRDPFRERPPEPLDWHKYLRQCEEILRLFGAPPREKWEPGDKMLL